MLFLIIYGAQDLIVDTATHFVGHMQEITYITRMYLGAGYAFRWTPATPEEGAPLY